jgi:hypothetical protein
VTVLLLILAAVCFGLSATRKFGRVPWLDLGLVLVAVALVFWLPDARVDLD